MMNHDIIDNRQQRLIDHIHAVLPKADMARFAVGYLFISGLEALGKDLDTVRELRLLIGNTTSNKTIEILAEGYRRLDLVAEHLEGEKFLKRTEQKRRAGETATNLREAVEVMDQTDDAEELTAALIRMIEQKRMKVRIYTKGRLHAKAYIFDWSQPNPGNNGIAIVGSSNLSLAGIQDNTELNVLVHDNANPTQPDSGNHAALVKWFEELWDESQDFDQNLMAELKESWAGGLASPYDIYMKTLYTLVKDRLEGEDTKEILWDDEITRALADFQKVAVHQAIQKIRDMGGCFVADVVGLGKSFIGAAIIKHFDRTEHCRALIICPKPLQDMWERYNEVYDLHARILPMSLLQADEERGVNLLEDVRYRDRDFVLIDESHNFRHHTSQRYEELQKFLATGGGRRACLLTATPLNSWATDVYNQIKLFHLEDTTSLPIDPPNLKEYFKLIEKKERRLQDLLVHVLIRRTRRHILRWYGYTEDTGQPLREMSEEHAKIYLNGIKRAYVMVGGRHQYFPKRELEALRYSIDETYNGLYQQLRSYIGKTGENGSKLQPGVCLTYARYGLWNFVKKDKQKIAPYTELHRSGINLRGLIRTNLFKRFESSVYAFRESLRRMLNTHEMFLTALDSGIIPAGVDAETLLSQSGKVDEKEIISMLEEVTGTYNIKDFEIEKLRNNIKDDIDLLRKMFSMVEPITPEQDDKLQAFLKRLRKAPIDTGKCLIFTQYADTAQYIYGNLNPNDKERDIDFIYGTDKSKSRVAWRFAPKANHDFSPNPPKDEIRLLVATDVLAEGLNLQDCSVVLNYDLHWNPVRLIQRFGRIDRIGSEFDKIYGLNFLPETALEKELGIQAVLKARIQEIHETIGEDAAILDKSEQINEESMYAIYERGEVEDSDEEDMIDLNEAEEYFRTLAKNDPSEYEKIRNLRDGIRSARMESARQIFVFCQAGNYKKLYLVQEDGHISSNELPTVLKAIMATKEVEGKDQLPQGYNQKVMKVKSSFAEEVKHLESQREHTIRQTLAQKYIMRELRALFSQSEDEDQKAQINEMEKAFRQSPTSAVSKELNILRRNGVVGESLLKSLIQIYHSHRLRDRLEYAPEHTDKNDAPRIICSELL